jgi:hypothetical protein
MRQKTHTITTQKEDHILIQKYWLLKDGKVAVDSITEPSRWLYEYQLVESRIINLAECPYAVRQAFREKPDSRVMVSTAKRKVA